MHAFQVHKLACDMGLRHRSTGAGQSRRIAVYKDYKETNSPKGKNPRMEYEDSDSEGDSDDDSGI